MVLFENKNKCCGCEACANACPTKAISMHTDEYGYEFPKIDEEKCISCGKCQRVCQYKTDNSFKSETKEVYAAASKDENILMTTASGGIFTTIAEKVIEAGGVVYGASLYVDGEINPSHIRVDNKSDLEQLKGSKYVQCSIGNIFNEIKKDLEEDRQLLFSGTPCQVAGLKNFLGKEYTNLYTIDIICHGVPNKKFFLDSLTTLGKGAKVIHFSFRDKTKGQGCNAKYITLDNNKEKVFTINGKLVSYFGLFLQQETFRDSCYSCLHTSKSRCGDLTIGDYWNIYIEHGKEVDNANLTNKKGISCILVNTEKGKELVADNADRFNLLASEFEKVDRHNNQLHEPSVHSACRECVLEAYRNDGFEAVDRIYQKSISKKKVLYKLEYIMPKDFKRKIKSFVYKLK